MHTSTAINLHQKRQTNPDSIPNRYPLKKLQCFPRLMSPLTLFDCFSNPNYQNRLVYIRSYSGVSLLVSPILFLTQSNLDIQPLNQFISRPNQHHFRSLHSLVEINFHIHQYSHQDSTKLALLKYKHSQEYKFQVYLYCLGIPDLSTCSIPKASPLTPP